MPKSPVEGDVERTSMRLTILAATLALATTAHATQAAPPSPLLAIDRAGTFDHTHLRFTLLPDGAYTTVRGDEPPRTGHLAPASLARVTRALASHAWTQHEPDRHCACADLYFQRTVVAGREVSAWGEFNHPLFDDASARGLRAALDELVPVLPDELRPGH